MKIPSRRFLIVAVLLFLSMIPFSCQKKPSQVVIGIALTRTNHAAVRLAVSEINATGGINGVPLEAAGLDWQVVDHFNAAEILKWAQKFADTKELVAVIGHSDSSSTLSAAAFYNQHQIPQIVTIATNPAITNIGQWTYRLCLSDDVQGPALAEYAVKEWGKKTVAVFYVNDAYGRVLAELFQKRVKELGGKIVASVMHRNTLEEGDRTLISLTLDDLKKNGEPDLIVLFERSYAGKWTVRAIRERGLRSDILGGDNLSLPQFTRQRPELTQGMRVSQFFWPAPDNVRAQEFVQAFTAFSDEPPDYGQAFAYDAVYLVRDAVLSGGFSRKGVKSYLDRLIKEQTTVNGVVGPCTFGSDHDARRTLNIVELRDGSQRFIKVLQVH